jgi:hypothetical protein
MDLTSTVVTSKATRQLTGSQTVEVAAGQYITVETTPEGEELLNEQCPAGKVWSVTTTIVINETDA